MVFRFVKPETIVLIGGGDTMIAVAEAARTMGLETRAILAPRHASEVLPLRMANTRDVLVQGGVDVSIVEDINEWGELTKQTWHPARTVALCFGPAWIFKQHVLARFSAMANYNPIPIPRYLGGAHYTWQIMNGDRKGGCILQLITNKLDRGPILEARYFDIPETARVPQDYFDAYTHIGNSLMLDTLRKIAAGDPFNETAYEAVNPNRLYFPRLFTAQNAFVDWAWSGVEIERFCCAFDRPYIGAGTFVGNEEIRLSEIRFIVGESFHPYVSGMVVRRIGDRTFVAVRDGLVEIGSAKTRQGQDAFPLLKEGRRLATPPEKVFDGMRYRPQITGKGIS